MGPLLPAYLNPSAQTTPTEARLREQSDDEDEEEEDDKDEDDDDDAEDGGSDGYSE